MTLANAKQPFSYFLMLLFFSIPCLSFSQELKNRNYYGAQYFLLEGTEIADSLKENTYDRLPVAYKELVRKPVWDLSKNTAGMSLRFFTNASSISVKWELLFNTKMNHMAETGIKGLDLYFNNNGTWQYINTAKPKTLENEYLLVKNMTKEMREFKIYLPLYDGIKNIEIGLDSNSLIEKPLKKNKSSIIFYGTSITQGGCASRPGMVHTNIISRKLNVDCVNFGFSGNGAMEQPVNDLIATYNPMFYVIECLPNMTTAQVKERTFPLVTTIRKQHAKTPIIFVDNFIFEAAALDQKMLSDLNEKNKALKNEYEKMIASGVTNVFYINAKTATGIDHEGTVDGVHFTDLGFMRYADFLLKKFEELGLTTNNP